MTPEKAKAVFSLRYAGSVGYYAAMLRYGQVAIDLTERYDKHRHSLNRTDIVGTGGRLQLSVPLKKPNKDMEVSEVLISEHGNWRHVHWGALFSAYGRTPFFEYFADDLKKIYDDVSIQTVADFNLAVNSAVVDFLGLPLEFVCCREKAETEGLKCADMRDFVLTEPATRQYWQIWASRHGFCPNLSILDMLFNVGREAAFYL